MSEQTSLFDGHPEFVAPAPRLTLDEAFDAFHAANPFVYDALCELARRMKARGMEKIGVGFLFEVLRWEWIIATDSADYRLNNNLRSRYARRIMAQEPDLAGVFEIRELRAA